MNDTHPEPAEIAALDADLLKPEEATQLREHLALCSGCAAISNDLELLSHELADIPSPSIPLDVAARIDAALDAEAASAAVVSRETQGRRARRWPRFALAAAAALVLLGVGGALLQSTQDEDETVTAVPGFSAGGGSTSRDDPLKAKVNELLTPVSDEPHNHSDDESLPQTAEAAEEGTVAVEDTVTTLPSCVRDALDRPRSERPLTAAKDDFKGQQAFVVVFALPGDPDHVDAYAVTDCTSSESPSARILAKGSYPRP